MIEPKRSKNPDLRVYITEELKRRADGWYAGPNILALSWEESEKKAAACGCRVLGTLEGIIPA